VADLGKILLGVGLVMILLGGLLLLVSNLSGKVPWLGRMPGDIYIEQGSWRFYLPVFTSITLSVLLTVLFWLFSRR
jgi:hypothetical protein